jgi:hypothetical protein
MTRCFPRRNPSSPGNPTNVQVSVKDSKLYAQTGGWGYAQFEHGVANRDNALIQSCYACHTKLEAGDDRVFTSYSH